MYTRSKFSRIHHGFPTQGSEEATGMSQGRRSSPDPNLCRPRIGPSVKVRTRPRFLILYHTLGPQSTFPSCGGGDHQQCVEALVQTDDFIKDEPHARHKSPPEGAALRFHTCGPTSQPSIVGRQRSSGPSEQPSFGMRQSTGIGQRQREVPRILTGSQSTVSHHPNMVVDL